MLVLIAQKRIEWDGRHNSNQPSLAKFVYGTTAWRLVLAGCMGVVGFRARDTDQITNKWDGLIKDFKKLKEYIEGTGSGNWWGLSREKKKEMSKTRRMPLEFSEQMYIEMEGFVGKRQIFGRASDVLTTPTDWAHLLPSLLGGLHPHLTPHLVEGQPAHHQVREPHHTMQGPARRVTTHPDPPGGRGRPVATTTLSTS